MIAIDYALQFVAILLLAGLGVGVTAVTISFIATEFATLEQSVRDFWAGPGLMICVAAAIFLALGFFVGVNWGERLGIAEP